MTKKASFWKRIGSAVLIAGLSAPGAWAFSSRLLHSSSDAQASSAEAASDLVWITRPDGAQSCSIQEGQSVEEGEAELKKAGVHVQSSEKSSDGKMHIQMCGASTGSMNAYLISRSDLPKAIGIGFREAARIPISAPAKKK